MQNIIFEKAWCFILAFTEMLKIRSSSSLEQSFQAVVSKSCIKSVYNVNFALFRKKYISFPTWLCDHGFRDHTHHLSSVMEKDWQWLTNMKRNMILRLSITLIFCCHQYIFNHCSCSKLLSVTLFSFLFITIIYSRQGIENRRLYG